ncbi:hypothetical protein [Neoasaia chiangmaiensis]|uniref:hypothetical protein n=1 Tax=Neoasaia chiangmaiensis TaxID=320497 RepID=UPI001479638E|nr:hypothetical protein [Neoasaia chiangmaiensis]
MNTRNIAIGIGIVIVLIVLIALFWPVGSVTPGTQHTEQAAPQAMLFESPRFTQAA